MIFKDYSFVFDIDGTLCPVKKKEERYEDLVPFSDMLDKLRYYKEYTAAVLTEWLKKWDIPYDEIVYGKVWPGHKGFYVDDRTIRPDEFLKYSLDELEDICKKSRCDEQ